VSTGIPCCKNFTITINGTLPPCVPVTPDMFSWYNSHGPNPFSPGALLATGLSFDYTLIPPPDGDANQWVLFVAPFLDDYVCDATRKCPFLITFYYKNDAPPVWGVVDQSANTIQSGVAQSVVVGQTFLALFVAGPALDNSHNPIPFGPEMNITGVIA